MDFLRSRSGHAFLTFFCALAVLQAGDKIRISAEKADVKLGARVLTILKKGDELEVVVRQDEWIGVRVEIGGRMVSGWVLKANVEDIKAEPSTVPGMQIAIETDQGRRFVDFPDLLAFVRTKSINHVISMTQQMVIQINPLLAGFVSPDSFGKALGNPQLKGVDRDRPLAFVILDPNKFKQPVVAIVPATNVNDIPRSEKRNVREVGNYALIGESGALDSVESVLEGFKSVPEDDLKSEIELRANVGRIMEAAAPQIKELFKLLKNLQQVGNVAGGGINPAAISEILKAEVDWLVDLTNQCREITLGIGIKADSLRFRSLVIPKEGTKLAKSFSSMKAPDHRLARILSQQPAVMAMTADTGQELWKALFADLGKMFGPLMSPDPAGAKEFEKNIDAVMNSLDGSFANTVVASSKGLAVSYCLGIKDADKYKILMREFTKTTLAQTSTMYKQMGVPMEFLFKPAARQSNGFEVDVMTYEFKQNPQMQNNPMIQQQIKMTEVMYGHPARIELAYLDKVAVMIMGKESSSQMDKLILLVQKGGGALSGDLQTAQGLFEKDGHMYGTFSLKEMASAVSTIGAAFVPALGNLPKPQIMGPPIAFYGKAVQGRMEFETYIPTKPFAALQAYFMQVQMQMMKQRIPPGGNQPAPLPPGPVL